MSKSSLDQVIEELSSDSQDDIGEEDYGFVFDADGNLKYVFIPENLPFKPPKVITRILKVIGVTDLSQFNEDISIH